MILAANMAARGGSHRLGDLDPIVPLSMAQRNTHCCGAVWVHTSESALPSVRVLQTRGRRELPSS